VKPSSTPYIIDDDMFLSNGALNIDHQLMKNIRQTNSQYEDEIIACRNALQKSEQEYAELQRRMTFLDAKLSYAQSLLRKQHRTPYARR
jgi:type II secretory pathway component PulJ